MNDECKVQVNESFEKTHKKVKQHLISYEWCWISAQVKEYAKRKLAELICLYANCMQLKICIFHHSLIQMCDSALHVHKL